MTSEPLVKSRKFPLSWPSGKERMFFSLFAGALALVILAGFLPSFYLRGILPSYGPPLRPLRADTFVHGVLATAFVLGFPTQAFLIAAGRRRSHERLGKAWLIAGLLLVPTLYLVATATYRATPIRSPIDRSAMATLSLLAISALAFLLWAVWNWRRDAQPLGRFGLIVDGSLGLPSRLPSIYPAPAPCRCVGAYQSHRESMQLAFRGCWALSEAVMPIPSDAICLGVESRFYALPGVKKTIDADTPHGSLGRAWLRLSKALVDEEGVSLDEVVTPDVRCFEIEDAGFSLGLPGLRAFRRVMNAAIPDEWVVITHMEVDAFSKVVETELLAGGTHTGELMGIPATGRAVEFRVRTLGKFEGDRLVRRWDRTDFSALLQQLRDPPSHLD